MGVKTGEELAQHYASADVLIFPSETETFGNVTLEAMASALPVVAATATGSQSLVRHGVTGALVPPGDISGFADALQLYCTDPQARGAAGHAGLEESQRFGWDEVNQALVDSYLRIISRRQG